MSKIAKQDEETLEQCIQRTMNANKDLSEEAARAMCEKKTEEKSAEEKGLADKMIAVMKEYTDAAIAEAKANTVKKIEEVKKELETELIESIRTGMGLTKDPTVHLSDVEALVRKIMLDTVPSGKRSETVTKSKPDGEGTETKKVDVEKRFEELQKQKGWNI